MPHDITAHALLLDMDGTLVNSDAVVDRLWRQWAEDHGLDPADVLRVAHGRQGYATMAAVLPDRPMADHYADNRRMLAKETTDTAGVVAIPGAAQLLSAADRGGLPHALVTSADLTLATARMAAAGLPMPRLRITAEQVSASKPDPEGFLKGAAEVGAAPADCLAFEDSAAGIAAARAAGMRVVGVGPRAAEHTPDVLVHDLSQVRIEALPEGSTRILLDS